MHAIQTSALAALVLASGLAFAHGEAGQAKKAARPVSTEEKPFGREGDPKRAQHTVRITMADTMRFSPAELKVRRGDTVKLVVANKGRLMHELVIGTMDELKAHAELMKKHPGMEHEEPWMAHVAPGKTETLAGSSRGRASSTTAAWSRAISRPAWSAASS